MNIKTLKELGYFQVTEILKGFAQSDSGASLCENLRPYDDFDKAVRESNRVSQLKRLKSDSDNIPFGRVEDIRGALALARVENSTLDIQTILDIKENLATTRRLKKFLERLESDEYPGLIEFTDRLHPNEMLERKISRTIGDNCEILDSASPELRRTRLQSRSKREEIIESLNHVMRDDENAPVIQEKVITVRNNRYVLIAKHNYNERFDGIIHGDSQSGASCYVEPLKVVEQNNKVNTLNRQVLEEERKVLRDITAGVRADCDNLFESVNALAEFDFLYAKARMSEAISCSEATLTERTAGWGGCGQIDLKSARHPLLLFDFLNNKATGVKRVIPINIRFEPDRRGMVVSGSNSGGKTASLKTLGLLTLMAKSGMHISAAEGSSLVFFKQVFADIGDEQDIRKSMGTFSSHLANINDIIERTDATTLVLLDELGTGTNPTEGSALFSAVLDHLIETGCYFVTTTHLDKIKHYAYVNSAVENVSVAFNDATLMPEYKLIYNQIGQSNAINLARQIGINAKIIKRANEYLSGDELKLSELLRELSLEKAELVKQKEELKRVKGEAERLKERRAKAIDKLREQRDLLIKSKEKEVSDLFYETKKSLKSIIKKHKGASINDIQAYDEITTLKKSIAKKFKIPRRGGKGSEELNVGDTVFVRNLNKKGVVLKVNMKEQTAVVNLGSVRIDIPVSELERSVADVSVRKSPVLVESSGDAKHEINVIGHTVDEALPLIDKFLDDAYLYNLSEVTIIHGKGTGRLRSGILRHIKQARRSSYDVDILAEKNVLASLGATRIKIKR